MSDPILYGVGAGPGAPDLLTLRAKRVLESAAVLALPRANRFAQSLAFRIIQTAVELRPEQERLFLTFPMSKQPGEVRPALESACEQIAMRLDQGKSVAFVTEGDPFTFSTFIYVRKELQRCRPQLQVEVVPGVSSIMAVPAIAGVPLADGQERIAILSGTAGFADLSRSLVHFDTVVLMKVGGALPFIVDTLERHGLLEQAVYVSRASQPEQRIERDLRRVSGERGDCFAMVLIKKHTRSGVLLGDSELSSGEGQDRHG
jgi:precorrin-2/cobalt-factor-2 C20-methyltransferase